MLYVCLLSFVAQVSFGQFSVERCKQFDLLVFTEEAVHSTGLSDANGFEEWRALEKEPYFDATIPSNVTGRVGKTIQLVCRVKNLGNRTVSTVLIDFLWLR